MAKMSGIKVNSVTCFW